MKYKVNLNFRNHKVETIVEVKNMAYAIDAAYDYLLNEMERKTKFTRNFIVNEIYEDKAAFTAKRINPIR